MRARACKLARRRLVIAEDRRPAPDVARRVVCVLRVGLRHIAEIHAVCPALVASLVIHREGGECEI